MPDQIPLRLALALGDQELEQRLRPALDVDDDLQVAVQCLAADQLVQAVETHSVDAVVLALGLHRLSDSVLAQLDRARLPVVVLVPNATAELESLPRASLLPVDADPNTLREAIKQAARGERWRAPRPRTTPRPQSQTALHASHATQLSILAVAGGSGSPGRTTLAINLATALGAVAPTVLVDLDCASPCVAAYLNRDPSRNVVTLAHAVRESPQAWTQALEQELQPLHPGSPSAVVLCGLPKRELRASLTQPVMERLIEELVRRYRYVVLDIGAEWLGTEAPAVVHRAALTCAQQVLLVTASDLVGLWHARTALAQLDRNLGIDAERISLVVNRHDPYFHHSLSEIEWHLGARAALVVPNDYRAVQRAMAELHPVVVDRTSRAGQAILRLAERIHQGRVRLPTPAIVARPRPRWQLAIPAGVASLLRWGGSS